MGAKREGMEPLPYGQTINYIVGVGESTTLASLLEGGGPLAVEGVSNGYVYC